MVQVLYPHVEKDKDDVKESLFFALEKRKDEIVDYLLEHHEGDINQLFSNYGEEPMPVLIFAAYFGTTHAFQKLLDHQGDPLIHYQGLNALHMATRRLNYEVVEFLVRKKLIPIDAPTQDDQQLSALMFTSMEDDLQIAKLLVEGGADINYQEADAAITPMHFAVLKKKNLPMVQILLSSSHKYLNLPSRDGETPLDMAKDLKQNEIARLLSEALGEVLSTPESSSDAGEGSSDEGEEMIFMFPRVRKRSLCP